MYNPLVDKIPYGATAVGKDTTIKFPLDSALGVKRVFVVLRQVYGEGGEILVPKVVRVDLPFVGSKNNEDVFQGSFKIQEYGIWMYRFEGELENGDLCFFGRDYDGSAVRGDWLPEWQLTVSKREYKTPSWAKEGVIYQIFADRFCKVGDNKFNKHGRIHKSWFDLPDIQEEGKDYKADDYFGGNIKGIISKLDYLKDLGVSCLYLSPIFESFSNHRYDTGDYLKIDELFGTEEEFKELIKKANALGINIMLDGVFNHTGADSIYFNREGTYDSIGAYQSKKSHYYDWYTFYEFPDDYYCWWGSTVVPTVNKSAQGFKNLVMGRDGVIEKWSKMGVKGWRLDVVDELPIDFTTELCKCIKSKGEDMFIVGEVWEDASTKIAYSEWRPYFMGEQLDSVMNYPFKEAILAYTLSGDKKAFINSITHILENYPKESLDVLLNLIDSHDTVRALTALGNTPLLESKKDRKEFKLSKVKYKEAKEKLMFASALQYILPGMPCLFYGDEAGMQGFEDPLNRGTYPWGKEDEDLLAHYKQLGEIRTKYKELLQGETTFVDYENYLEIRRTNKDSSLVIVVSTEGDIDIKNKCIYSLLKGNYCIKIYKEKALK